ncbi:MAG: hypothetical protein IJ814_08605 [Paludibacteraceae bacterium]|nr:hypothetical protein [Paludibacteraceae bacterium]
MSVKIFKIATTEALNCKIHPVLYRFYLRLKDTLAAEMVHRRKRSSATCIEIIFYCDEMLVPTGRLNTLPEAEKWGFWVICRLQSNPKHAFYRAHRVYQLYLSPVHPKKRREAGTTITPLSSLSDYSVGKSKYVSG